MAVAGKVARPRTRSGVAPLAGGVTDIDTARRAIADLEQMVRELASRLARLEGP